MAATIERAGMASTRPTFMRCRTKTLLGVTARHLSILETLPVHHKDPFDHLLIAQALAENLTLVTVDRHMRLYAVRTLPCSVRAAG